MRRRILITSVVATALVAAALITYRAGFWHPSSDLESESPASAWPMDQAWSWSFKAPDKVDARSGVTLLLRVKTEKIPSNTQASFGVQSRAMDARDASREFGTARVRPAASGSATVQLLDLSTIGIASARPGQDLRILAKLRVGGMEIRLGPDDIFLPAGYVAGHSAADGGRWTNGELYLMTFHVRGEGTISQYDVLLKCASVPGS